MRRYVLLVVALVAAGCAKLPSGGSQGSGTIINLSMTMQQPINPGFTYVMALNPTTVQNPVTQGPIPVIAPPWGNGIVGGNSQYLVIWNLNAPQGQQAQIYNVPSPGAQPIPTAFVPITFSQSPDGLTLNAEVLASEIAPSAAVAQTYQGLQVNFLTMSIVPTPQYTGSRIEDALGNQNNPNTINSWITIPLNTSGTYNNARYGGDLTSPNWVSDPTLDIVNFSVQITPAG
jgi:hypothetical protein